MRTLKLALSALALSVVAASAASAAPFCPQGWTEAQCAALAGKAHDALGGNERTRNFAVTDEVKFTCPDGKPGKQVRAVDADGYTFARWACPHTARVVK